MVYSINTCSRIPLQLRRGCAMTFRSTEATVLHVTAGRVWATISSQQQSDPQDQRDLVLTPGSELPVPAGEKVVVEAWPLVNADSSALVWEPAAGH